MRLASRFLHILLATFLLPLFVFSQASRESIIRPLVDSLRIAGNFPGLSVAIIFEDNTSLSIASGYADKESGIMLKPTDRFLQGSVGKTYVSAIAMQLIKNNKIQLDENVSKYLGNTPWYGKIPNAEDITVRMLMNHTSGVMRYEFKEAFTTDLTNHPDKEWKPEELIEYVLGEQAPFKAGTGWEYSDTNYILLGMIIESVTGQPYYTLLEKEILKPLKLKNTFPSNKRKLDGLVQGYAGKENAFGNQEKVLDDKRQFVINPQFEWTGGGIYSTTHDLARWGKMLYEGKAFDASLLPTMLEGVPAKLGKDARYGLGVIIKPTPYGITYGHSGFFPGYLTELVYFPDYKMCIAVQTNTSDFKNMKVGLSKVSMLLAELTSKYKL